MTKGVLRAVRTRNPQACFILSMVFRWCVSPSLRSFRLSPGTVVNATSSPTAHHVLIKRGSLHSSSAPLSSTSRLNSRTWMKLWLFPFGGGILLYVSSNPQLQLPLVFASPTLIPCTGNQSSIRHPLHNNMIGSPAEVRRPILSQVLNLFLDYIWEPFLTARRFVHLFYLFLPVIITAPMLLVGMPEKKLHGDRWGAVWWYELLVSKMEAAGPTFIKVI